MENSISLEDVIAVSEDGNIHFIRHLGHQWFVDSEHVANFVTKELTKNDRTLIRKINRGCETDDGGDVEGCRGDDDDGEGDDYGGGADDGGWMNGAEGDEDGDDKRDDERDKGRDKGRDDERDKGRDRDRDEAIVDSISMIQHIQEKLLQYYPQRPRHLLLFVNPGCGNNNGKTLYEEKVAPIFKLAKIKVQIVYPYKVKEMYSYLLRHDLSSYDGIVVLGGDGSFHEVVSGVMDRHHIEAGIDLNVARPKPEMPSITVGCLPGGSGNAAANDYTGINDLATAALHIVIGARSYRDVITATNIQNSEFLGYAAVIVILQQGMVTEIRRMNRLRSLLGRTRYFLAPFIALFLPNKVRQLYNFESRMVCRASTPTGKCGRNCHYCQKRGDLDEVFVNESQNVGSNFNLWNTRGISFWEGSGFFPENHTGDGAFTVVSKFKDDFDIFKMLRCFLALEKSTSGEELKDYWSCDSDITNYVKEVTFKYIPKSIADTSNRPDLVLDGEIPHKPIGIADLTQLQSHSGDSQNHAKEIPPVQPLSYQVDELLFLCHQHILPVFGAGVDETIPSWDPKETIPSWNSNEEKNKTDKYKQTRSKITNFFANLFARQISDDNNNSNYTHCHMTGLNHFVYVLLIIVLFGGLTVICYPTYWQ